MAETDTTSEPQSAASSIGIGIKRMGAIAVALLALITLTTTTANLLQVGEPHWIATRSFVREQVGQAETKSAVRDAQMSQRAIKTEIQVLRGRRESLNGEIKRRELLLEDPAAQASAEYRRLVREQIDQYREQLKDIDNELDGLQREQSGRRP